MNNCDIIVPIYNAFDYLKRCIESVLLYTDLNINRLILIDDCSTDTKIIPYIEDLILNNKKNIILLKNDINLGFVKTTNIGMKFSSNDVLLLNSDTEVTKDWLRKIQMCAYSKNKIATVTPLSNNSGITSVPVFNKQNDIPPCYDLHSFQNLIDHVSYLDYPEIPTGIGFCLFIKREALDVVGYFDCNTFEYGYGEEEDFCYRCLYHGYFHVLCDNVIIFHKGTQSFNNLDFNFHDSKQNIILKKHYYYKNNTNIWYHSHPLEYINKNINYNLCLYNGNSNILIIIHTWDLNPYENKYFGGTTFHVFDIINKLRAKYNFHVLSPYKNFYRLFSYWKTGEEFIDIYSAVSQTNKYNFNNQDYSKMVSQITDLFKIDLVHIQHMVGHYFDLLETVKFKNLKLIITLHDYYSVCPRINKINSNNSFCDNQYQNDCNTCLKKYSSDYFNNDEIDIIKIWHNNWWNLLSFAEKIIVPSETSKNEITNTYEDLSIDVIEHGIDIKHSTDVLSIDSDYIYNIAFLGNLSIIKGKKIVEELVILTNEFDKRFQFHLFGMIYSEILPGDYKNFINHGGYNRDDLKMLFKKNNIKLVCIFSLCSETFCYTLVESLTNNIPVLVIDIGIVGEKVKKNNLGWLINKNATSAEIYSKILNIFADKEEYKKVSKTISEFKIKNLNEMSNDYDKIYYNMFNKENILEDKLDERKLFIKDNYLPKNILNKENIITSSCIIYVDTGSGFNFNEIINSSLYMQGNNFDMLVSLNPSIKQIRFNPFKGNPCLIYNLQIYSDNGEIKHSYSNGIEINGVIIFETLDPQITIDFNKKAYFLIKISGCIFKFKSNDTIVASNLFSIFNHCLETENRNKILSTENDLLKDERDGFLRSRSWFITRPLRFFSSVIRKHKLLLLIAKCFLSIKKVGLKKTISKIAISFSGLKTFFSFFDNLLTDEDKKSQKNAIFNKNIKISLITPLYNTQKIFLKEMLESVKAQTYKNWELCLTDGSDFKHRYVKRIVKSYAKEDLRIKYKSLKKNFGISQNSNKAVEISSGEYLGILDHDDILHPSALHEVISAICNEDADFIYSDEATISNKDYSIVYRHYKPDFAIDTLRSCNYICHFTVFSRKLVEQAGVFNDELDGSQDHDLFLRYTDRATKIHHIPKILYFWRSYDDSVASNISNKTYAISSGINAVKKHLEFKGLPAHVQSTKIDDYLYRITYALTQHPLVSIIVPNKDNVHILRNCLSSIIEKTTYNNYEIIIVENNSVESNTFNFYNELKNHSNIKITYWEGKEFNYSAINNYGIQHSKGSQLILLNNDIEIITPNWIEEMLMYCQRDDVGAVGIKLIFPDNTIQHAGVILGLGGVAGHLYRTFPTGTRGYFGRLHFVQNLTAVTAACMMVKRTAIEQAGLFDPEFSSSFNDVDLCMKIRKAGYLIVWTPFAEAYHHESKSRGYDDKPDKQIRIQKEAAIFKKRWAKELEEGDPYYNPNFSLYCNDYSFK